jgi:hypothetical protein
MGSAENGGLWVDLLRQRVTGAHRGKELGSHIPMCLAVTESTLTGCRALIWRLTVDDVFREV